MAAVVQDAPTNGITNELVEEPANGNGTTQTQTQTQTQGQETAPNESNPEEPKEKRFIFMNGINILTRAWKKGQEIEYDSDAAGKFKSGEHVHVGKVINITEGAAGSNKIIIKDKGGSYVAYGLNEVKLKLEDNGTKIIQYNETKMRHSVNIASRPRPKRYKFMPGENLLFHEFRSGQEIEYDSGNEGGTASKQHIHKGVIEQLVPGDDNMHKILIKQEDGMLYTYSLNDIKIKFEDDGTEIMSDNAFRQYERVQTAQNRNGQHNQMEVEVEIIIIMGAVKQQDLKAYRIILIQMMVQKSMNWIVMMMLNLIKSIMGIRNVIKNIKKNQQIHGRILLIRIFLINIQMNY